MNYMGGLELQRAYYTVFLVLPLFCFVLFRFRLFAFTEAAALPSFGRSSFFDMHAPRQPHTVSYLTTVCVLFRFCFFLFSFLWRLMMSGFFPSGFVPFTVTSFLCMESTSYVFSFLMTVLFYRVTTGWIFLCENSINHSSNHKINLVPWSFVS